jgi:hypothetical protein
MWGAKNSGSNGQIRKDHPFSSNSPLREPQTAVNLLRLLRLLLQLKLELRLLLLRQLNVK